MRKLAASMNMTLAGALVGTAIALLLVAAEYFALRARAVARAKHARLTYRTKSTTPQLNVNERQRIASIARYCIFVPAAFAGAFWLVWG